MAVPVAAAATAAAPAIAAAADGLKDVTNGLFQTLGTMNYNNNKRKVIIEKIKGEVTMYLANLEFDATISKYAMDVIRSSFESTLNQANLSFQERMEILDKFTGAMLTALSTSLRR